MVLKDSIKDTIEDIQTEGEKLLITRYMTTGRLKLVYILWRVKFYEIIRTVGLGESELARARRVGRSVEQTLPRVAPQP